MLRQAGRDRSGPAGAAFALVFLVIGVTGWALYGYARAAWPLDIDLPYPLGEPERAPLVLSSAVAPPGAAPHRPEPTATTAAPAAAGPPSTSTEVPHPTATAVAERLRVVVVGRPAAAPPPGSAAAPAPTAPAAGCRFVLGFARLRDRLGADRVGDCLEDERRDPTSDDTVQRTTRGLLVWRPRDGATAFTDGQRTWVLGPEGLQERPNDERFTWESGPEPRLESGRAGDRRVPDWALPG